MKTEKFGSEIVCQKKGQQNLFGKWLLLWEIIGEPHCVSPRRRISKTKFYGTAHIVLELRFQLFVIGPVGRISKIPGRIHFGPFGRVLAVSLVRDVGLGGSSRSAWWLSWARGGWPDQQLAAQSLKLIISQRRIGNGNRSARNTGIPENKKNQNETGRQKCPGRISGAYPAHIRNRFRSPLASFGPFWVRFFEGLVRALAMPFSMIFINVDHFGRPRPAPTSHACVGCLSASGLGAFEWYWPG